MSVNKFGNLRARMKITCPILDSSGCVTHPVREKSVSLGVVWGTSLEAAAESMKQLRAAIKDNNPGSAFSDRVTGKFTVEL